MSKFVSMFRIVPIARFMIDTTDGQPQCVVNLPHPNGVSSGKIIVNGHHMNALAGNSVEIRRQSSNQSLAFASPHLGDFTLMQNNPAQKLNIKMPLAECSLGRFPLRPQTLPAEYRPKFVRFQACFLIPQSCFSSLHRKGFSSFLPKRLLKKQSVPTFLKTFVGIAEYFG